MAAGSTKVRQGNEDADNAVIDESLMNKSTQILRKVKALKFEGTKQYM